MSQPRAHFRGARRIDLNRNSLISIIALACCLIGTASAAEKTAVQNALPFYVLEGVAFYFKAP